MQFQRSRVHDPHKIERRDDWRSIGVPHEIPKDRSRLFQSYFTSDNTAPFMRLIAR
jgi:hypothetical protein